MMPDRERIAEARRSLEVAMGCDTAETCKQWIKPALAALSTPEGETPPEPYSWGPPPPVEQQPIPEGERRTVRRIVGRRIVEESIPAPVPGGKDYGYRPVEQQPEGEHPAQAITRDEIDLYRPVEQRPDQVEAVALVKRAEYAVAMALNCPAHPWHGSDEARRWLMDAAALSRSGSVEVDQRLTPEDARILLDAFGSTSDEINSVRIKLGRLAEQ